MSKSVIQQARDKGWDIYVGTLQAKGLFRGIRNEAKTDDDVTLWASSREEAAREALKISAAEESNGVS